MNKTGAAGFSLVEVLVSIVVLAVGVIGAAGMQLTALRTAQQSGLQTTALQLAAELADRMRVNADQMRLADKANPFLGIDYKTVDGTPEAPIANCFAVDCDGDQLAQFDLYEWRKRIQAGLPGGRAVVCRDSTPWDASSKRLAWDCEGKGATSASLVIKIGWRGKDPGGKLAQELEGESVPAIALVVAPYVP
jgi:type IV pilus assembly protein PilV